MRARSSENERAAALLVQCERACAVLESTCKCRGRGAVHVECRRAGDAVRHYAAAAAERADGRADATHVERAAVHRHRSGAKRCGVSNCDGACGQRRAARVRVGIIDRHFSRAALRDCRPAGDAVCAAERVVVAGRICERHRGRRDVSAGNAHGLVRRGVVKNDDVIREEVGARAVRVELPVVGRSLTRRAPRRIVPAGPDERVDARDVELNEPRRAEVQRARRAPWKHAERKRRLTGAANRAVVSDQFVSAGAQPARESEQHRLRSAIRRERVGAGDIDAWTREVVRRTTKRERRIACKREPAERQRARAVLSGLHRAAARDGRRSAHRARSAERRARSDRDRARDIRRAIHEQRAAVQNRRTRVSVHASKQHRARTRLAKHSRAGVVVGAVDERRIHREVHRRARGIYDELVVSVHAEVDARIRRARCRNRRAARAADRHRAA